MSRIANCLLLCSCLLLSAACRIAAFSADAPSGDEALVDTPAVGEEPDSGVPAESVEAGQMPGKDACALNQGRILFAADTSETGHNFDLFTVTPDGSGLVQITDESQLEEMIATILAANPGPVAQYRAGKTKTFGFFVGQVMKATQGKANPQIVNALLKKRLAES